MLKPYIPTGQIITRRKELENLLPKKSALILLSNSIQYRSNDTEYKFHQNPNFWYLTGFNQPKSIFVFLKNADAQCFSYLFLEKPSPKEIVFSGDIPDFDQIKELSQLDKVFESHQLIGFLENELDEEYSVCLDTTSKDVKKIKVIKHILKNKNIETEDVNTVLKELRLIKSKWEISQMKTALEITLQTHKYIQENISFYPFLKNEEKLNECQLEAEILRNFQYQGADWAYCPIVASGKNSTILHYNQNNDFFNPDDLILIDAGCQYNYYNSDITRTFCQKEMKTEQKEIYELVESVQQKTIQYLKQNANKISIKELDNFAVQHLSQGMIQLGIFKKSLSEVIENKLYKIYYPHSISHFIGLDTHDLSQKEDYTLRKLEPGMVITVEPGLYFRNTDENSKKYQNIGVRIEDNYLITDNSAINLIDFEKEKIVF
jgi:Xaa-Pro aminopeptidase